MIRSVRLDAVAPPPVVRDPGILDGYLEDASGAAPGRAAGLVRPADEAEAAAFLRASLPDATPVLPQAARSSLTGAAVPHGEVIVSVEALDSLGPPVRTAVGARCAVGAGMRLDRLQERLAADGLTFPPVPTYRLAMLGGTVATNAGGAASFKYGVTRRWVRGLRVLLFNGDVLELERGEAVAGRGESFRIALSDGQVLEVPAPTYRLPGLAKISAGYHSADRLDLVDLFVGSEGTLGLITEVTLDLIPRPPGVVSGVAFGTGTPAALALAAELRDAARQARGDGDDGGPDVRSIEWIDRRGLGLLRDAAGATARNTVPIPAGAGHALLFELELQRPMDAAAGHDAWFRLVDSGARPGDGPLGRLFGILERHGAVDGVELAFDDEPRRRAGLLGLREELPLRVNEIVSRSRGADPAVCKVGGDLIVPFDRLAEMIRIYERGFEARGLPFAIWGHLSDGNLHPNALPRNAAEVRLGFEALLEFAAEAGRRGGCPLSEHGVGRSAIKQEMLHRWLGQDAMDQMRRVKAALDPVGRFSPGVLFR